MDKNRKLGWAAAAVAVALTALALLTSRPVGEVQQADEGWRFVADIEVRDAEGAVLAAQTVSADGCTPDAEVPGGCALSWSWEEEFPAGSNEWYLPRFEVTTTEGYTETVQVAYVDRDCPVNLELCGVDRLAGEPSSVCLAALAECGIEQDGRGYYNNGPVIGGSTLIRNAVFFEPLAEEGGEWWESCPIPPPTATDAPPQPTYTPRPTYTPVLTPTCRPTWTPGLTYTPYPTDTPYPTPLYTPYPTQPPW